MGFGRIVAVIALVAGLSLLGVLTAYCAKPPTAAGPACTPAEIEAVSDQLRAPRNMQAATNVLAREEVAATEYRITVSVVERIIRMQAMRLFHRHETARAWCSLTKERPRYGLPRA